MTYYPSLGIHLHSSKSLGSFEPSYEGTLKLNVDGSFLEDSFCLGVDGVIRSNEGDCVADFSHHKVDGDDALPTEFRVIQMRLEFCCSK
ncbi:proteasome subunit alpha type, partial [Trifolium pratense]